MKIFSSFFNANKNFEKMMFHIFNFMLNGREILFVQKQWSKIVSILWRVHKTDHPIRWVSMFLFTFISDLLLLLLNAIFIVDSVKASSEVWNHNWMYLSICHCCKICLDIDCYHRSESIVNTKFICLLISFSVSFFFFVSLNKFVLVFVPHHKYSFINRTKLPSTFGIVI